MTWNAQELAFEVELEFAYAEARAPVHARLDRWRGFTQRHVYTRLWSRPAIHCRVCGAVFVPLDSRRVYCSRPCLNTIHNGTRGETRLAARRDRPCLVCGTTFTATRSDARYCSAHCRKCSGYRRRVARVGRYWQQRRTPTTTLKSHRAGAPAVPLPSPVEVPEVEKSSSGLGGSGCTRCSLWR